MILSKELKEAVLKLQKVYPEKRSALIPALHMVQAETGYLPKEVQEQVAALFGIDVNEVNAVVTFYDMFTETPAGKHHVHVCKNLSCMLRGADDLLHGLCGRLGIKPGETTADGEFTVMASECLAACDRAPFCLVDDQEIGPVHDAQTLIDLAKKGKGHASPIVRTDA